MNEVLANLYAVTGNPDHLKLARAFNHEAIFDPLARGEDQLDGKHANTQIPKIIGAARQYELTGERPVCRRCPQLLAVRRPRPRLLHRRPQRPRAVLPRDRFCPAPQPCHRRDVQHLQHAQAYAPPVRLAAVGAHDGFLRARPLQPHPRLARPRDRHDVLLRLAQARPLQELQHAERFLLVLHRHRHREPRQVRRHDLRARRRHALRQPVHPLRTDLERKRRRHPPGNQVPRKRHDAPDLQVRQARQAHRQSPPSVLDKEPRLCRVQPPVARRRHAGCVSCR